MKKKISIVKREEPKIENKFKNQDLGIISCSEEELNNNTDSDSDDFKVIDLSDSLCTTTRTMRKRDKKNKSKGRESVCKRSWSERI